MSSLIPRAYTQTYPAELGAILNAPWIWLPDYALELDERSYAMMRRDVVVAHALDFRKHLEAGHNWFLLPASPKPVDVKAAQCLEQLIKQIPYFASARFDMAEATVQGESWEGIRGAWQTMSISDGPPRRWWTISKLVNIDKRRFRQEKASGPGEESEWRWKIIRPETQQWEPIEPTFYVHHIVGTSEAALNQGDGLGNRIFHAWRNKAECLKLWLQRLDRWALGNLIAKVGLDAGDRRDPANSKRVQSWLKVLTKMRHGHCMVFGVEDAVQLVEASGDGHEIRAAIDYHDDGIVRAALGSIMPTGGSSGNGSYARAETEAESTSTVTRFGRTLLEETITAQIVRLLYRANYAAILAECGGVQPSGVPEFRLKQERGKDPLKMAQVFQILAALKVPARKDELYEALELTPPAAGDAVFDWANVVAPPAKGFGSPMGTPLGAPHGAPPPLDPEEIAARVHAARGTKPPASPVARPKERIAALLAGARAKSGA